MPKLPIVGAREVVKVLEKTGFTFSFQSGSHATFRNPFSNRRVTVPLHRGKTLKKGTLRAIIRQAGLTVGEFIKLID